MTMQAYLNDPKVKNRLMRRLHEDHAGIPPVKQPRDLTTQIDIPGSAPIIWPGALASRGGLDYEAHLGIPMTIAVVAEAVWTGAGAAYADTWPARSSAAKRNRKRSISASTSLSRCGSPASAAEAICR